MAVPVPESIASPDLSVSLLRVILRNAPIETVVAQGFTYSQVAFGLSALLSAGLAVEKGQEISISPKGMEVLRAVHRGSNFIWMGALDERRIAKAHIMDAYFPGRLSLLEVKHRTRI